MRKSSLRFTVTRLFGVIADATGPRWLGRVLTLVIFSLAPMLAASDLDTAVEHFKARRFVEAQTLFTELALKEPKDATIAYYLGVLALRRGEPAEAVRHLERSVALNPTSARGFNALGDAYGLSAQKAGLFSKLGLAKQCLASYEKAVALEPEVVSFRLSLLAYYAQAPALAGGGREKAVAAAKEIQRLDPLRGGLSLINLHVSTKDWADAFALADELDRTFPDNWEIRYQQGRLAALSGLRVDEGIAALRFCLGTPPASGSVSVAQVHFRLGGLLEKKGDLSAARVAYQNSLNADANHRLAQEALSRLK